MKRTDCREWLTWPDKRKWPDRTSSFRVRCVLLSTIILIFLLSSSVSLSYLNLAVPMLKCLRKHSCMSSQFSIVILKGICYRAPMILCGDVPAIQQLNYKQTNFRKQRAVCSLCSFGCFKKCISKNFLRFLCIPYCNSDTIFCIQREYVL